MSGQTSGVVARIRRFNQSRRPDLLAHKYAKLRTDAFSFFRGTGHLFYEAWAPPAELDEAPLSLVSGDVHLENFGAYIGDNGRPCFSVNDFDEAALAPVTWDLARFVASLLVGLATLKRPAGAGEELAGVFLEAYAQTLALGGAPLPDSAVLAGPIGEILRAFPSRFGPEFLNERTQLTSSGRKLRIDDKRFLPITDAERAQVAELVEGAKHGQAGRLRVVDVARLLAGTSSLGLDRYALLVKGEGEPDGNRVLDLKEARPSCLGPYLRWPQPAWPDQAARVVTAQQRCQDVPPALLAPLDGVGKSYILREYSRARDRVSLTDARLTEARLARTVRTLGQVVANGHWRGRQTEGAAAAGALQAFARDRGWRSKLVAYAQRCAAQCQADYQTYCVAYDRGELAQARPAALLG